MFVSLNKEEVYGLYKDGSDAPCKSYDEAVEKTKELLKHRILQYLGKIEGLKADIEKYKTMLAEFEKGGDTE